MPRNPTITDADLTRALHVLPAPLFRQRDAYDAAELIGLRYIQGTSLWLRLIERGLIVRTATPIGRSTRRFFWERTPVAAEPYDP